MGKGPNGSDEFDFDSRGEAKGRGRGKKGTKKSREVIKLEAVFHSGPRVRIATYVCITSCLLSSPTNLSFQGRRTPVQEQLGNRPRALREFGHPPPLILPLTETAHLSIPCSESRDLAVINCRPFTRPLSVTWVQLPIGSPPSVVPRVRSAIRPTKVSAARNNR